MEVLVIVKFRKRDFLKICWKNYFGTVSSEGVLLLSFG